MPAPRCAAAPPRRSTAKWRRSSAAATPAYGPNRSNATMSCSRRCRTTPPCATIRNYATWLISARPSRRLTAGCPCRTHRAACAAEYCPLPRARASIRAKYCLNSVSARQTSPRCSVQASSATWKPPRPDTGIGFLETGFAPLRTGLGRIAAVACGLDGRDGAVFILVRSVAADAHGTDGLPVRIQNQHAARDRDEAPVGCCSQRAEEGRTTGQTVADRARGHAHAERGPGLAECDIEAQHAAAVFALERDEVAP